jgi:nucleotide-binding universal stress UspA family protein
MIERLLLAVGRHDETRLDELVDTAADVVSPGGRVYVLHVFEREEYDDLREKLRIDPDSETTPDDVARRQSNANGAADRLADRGVDVTVRGALGDEADAILATATDIGADMVVVGGRKRSQTGKLLFGSTAQDVLIGADCPVTFVKARAADDETVEPAVEA